MVENIVWLGVLLGSLTAISVALRKAYRAAREFFALQTAASRLISAEMTKNGGGSLLDKVDEIAPNHAIAEGHWKALRTQQEAMLERIVNVEEAVLNHGPIPCLLLNDLTKKVETMGGAA